MLTTCLSPSHPSTESHKTDPYALLRRNHEHLSDQPSLKPHPDDAFNSDSSWRQLQQVASVGEEEMMRLRASKSDLTATFPGLEETEGNHKSTNETVVKSGGSEVAVTPKAQDAAALNDRQGARENGAAAAAIAIVASDEEPDRQDSSPGDLKAAPSGTSSLSASPTEDHAGHYFDPVADMHLRHGDYRHHPHPVHHHNDEIPALHHHRGYHPPHRSAYPHRHHLHSPRHYRLAAPLPPPRRPVGAASTASPAHLHGLLSIARQTGGDDISLSASTISTKAILVAADGSAFPPPEGDRGGGGGRFSRSGHPLTPNTVSDE